MIRDFIYLDKIEPQHNELHRKLFTFGFGIIEKKFTTIPTISEVPVGYGALYESGGVLKLYINFYGSMKYITLT